MGRLSEHFDSSEFACSCGCGFDAVNPRLVECLELLREACGNRPIHITSGCRCERHNQEVGGAPNSQHVKGNAVDIVVEGLAPWQVFREAEKLGVFGGIKAYRTFTHVDIGPDRRW